MATYKPGNYTISATVTMPAETARKMGAPERAQYSGDKATRTFGPVETRVQSATKGDQLAARFVAFCLAEQPGAKYTISSFTINAA